MKKLEYKKKICLVTTSRADYWLMKELINIFKKDYNVQLNLLVTGQHLSKKYGYTYKEILLNHKKNTKLINIGTNRSDKISILNSMSNVFKKIGKYFIKNKIDLIIILGDRYETACIALTAYTAEIKIAHIHGGEKTTGSMDDSFRHAITKLSNIHFVSSNDSKKRIIQIGENKRNVYLVGGLGAEMISTMHFFERKFIEKKTNIKFKKNNFLICINAYLDNQISKKKLMQNIFKSLNKFKNTNFIFTLPNSDIDSDIILKSIYEFKKSNKNCYIFKSLGSHMYLSLMKNCDLLLGNSSSGILEAPSLKIPSVNIGKRQNGRLKSISVIDSKTSHTDIYKSIKKALSQSFKKKVLKAENIYYKKDSSKKIFNIIKSINVNKLSYKNFKDIN